MSKRDVSVGVKIDGSAKGFKAAAQDAQKATQNMAQKGKQSANTLQSSYKKLSAGLGPIVLVIGAIFGAFKSLQSVVMGSVEGQQKMASVMGQVSGILAALKDIAIDATNWLMKAFDDPKAAALELWNVIKENLVNRVQGFIDFWVSGWQVISQGAKGVALAVAGIFDSDKRAASKAAFAEMETGLKNMGKASLQTLTGVEDIIGKTKQLGQEIAATGRAAQALAERETALRLKTMADLVAIQKLDNEISAARRVASDEQATLNDRIAAQAQAMELIDKKFEIQEKAAAERLRIQLETNDLAHSTIEDLEKAAQLETELLALQQARDNEARSLQRRYNTLLNEQEAAKEAELKAIEEVKAAKAQALAEEAQARQDILNNISDSYLTEIERNQAKLDEILAAHEWTEEEKQRITQYYADQRLAILDKEAQAVTTIAEGMKQGFGGALEEISAGFNSMAMQGKISTGQLLKQTLASVTGLLIKSIMASGLPLFGKLALAGGASALAGGLMSKVPAFASGAIVNGPTLAQVGEYPRAAVDPEVISPLSKLKKMMGSSQVNVNMDGVIRGRDIHLVLTRYMAEENINT